MSSENGEIFMERHAVPNTRDYLGIHTIFEKIPKKVRNDVFKRLFFVLTTHYSLLNTNNLNTKKICH
jgi:hypothetical protein